MTASIILVAGARPNFMKIAPVLRALDARLGPEARRLVHTGQHYDAALSQVFFDETMAAALAAVKLGIPVAHVEAAAPLLRPRHARGDQPAGDRRGGGLALVTLHRPSNVDGKDRLEALLGFLERIAARTPVVFPAHPRTRARLEAFGLSARVAAIRGLHLSEPLPYRANLSLMASARLVITDSGGIQEETSFLGVPCLTLRPSTERLVTVTFGTNTIVGEDLGRAETLVDDILAGRYKTGAPIPLWDGHAAERVADVLARAWQ